MTLIGTVIVAGIVGIVAGVGSLVLWNSRQSWKDRAESAEKRLLTAHAEMDNRFRPYSLRVPTRVHALVTPPSEN